MFLVCYFCTVSFSVLSPLLKLRDTLITVNVHRFSKERKGLKSLHVYFNIFAPLSTSDVNPTHDFECGIIKFY